MLLGTFVNEVWWPSCGKLRECTRVGYESAYRCHIQPKWADVDMESITANDIEEWLGSFNQAGAARKAWAVLRAIQGRQSTSQRWDDTRTRALPDIQQHPNCPNRFSH